MLPEPAPWPGDERLISYYICTLCADDTFPLQENMMKPYRYKDIQIERRVISIARRVVENAFGIMANKFMVFHKCIGANCLFSLTSQFVCTRPDCIA